MKRFTKRIAALLFSVLLLSFAFCTPTAAVETDCVEWEMSEDEDYYDEPVFSETTAVVLFWIAYALLGFAAPIPFLVFGYSFPQSERRGYPKYWYAVGIAATVWIVSAGVLMLFLIL